MKIIFKGKELAVREHRYQNGRIALACYDPETNEPWAVATVNMPEIDLAEDELLLKGWSENEGLPEAFVEAGLVSPTDRVELISDFVSARVYQLTAAFYQDLFGIQPAD